MSADNFGVVGKHEGRWHVWMGSGSNDTEEDAMQRKPMASFDTEMQAIDYANDYGDFEYGFHIYRSKPGPKENEALN